MRVYVTGSSGLVGRAVVAELVARGHEAVALARSRDRAPRGPGIEVRELDLLDLDAIPGCIGDCEAGIHAAGVGPSADAKTQHSANVMTSRHLAAAAMRSRNTRRLVAITSAAVCEPVDSIYRQYKIGQEAALKVSGLLLTILRPTLVLGPPDHSAEMAALARRLARGTVWIPGGGQNRIQPVFLGDVARAAVSAVERDAAVGRELVVAGPDGGIRYRDLLESIRLATGGGARIRSVPLWMVRAAGPALSLIGRGQEARATIAYFGNDHTYPTEPMVSLLDVRPTPLDEAIRRCFGGAEN